MLVEAGGHGAPLPLVDLGLRPHVPEVVRRNGIKEVFLVQPRRPHEGNFELVAIPRQGMLFLSSALRDHEGPYVYNRSIWFEDRAGRLDPDRDLQGVDILLVTALINETPGAYEIARLAKEAHPNIKIVGGGPQMGMLPSEAFERAPFDVIVQGEGEYTIGDICDVLLTREKPDERNRELRKIGGLTFMEDGHLERVPQTPTIRMLMLKPDRAVVLPDFDSIVDLTRKNPMAGGVVETTRGCTESCSYCEVIRQFPGYRRVDPATEIKRLLQVVDLADRGLIAKSPGGQIPVFISDDLHAPPIHATKFHEDRLARAHNWREAFLAQGIDPRDQFFFTSQNRAELGSDPQMMDAFVGVGMRMVYLGVESNDARNLAAVNKRQNERQMSDDLDALKARGIHVVAMTIIGLPYDTRERVMEMADWIREHSHYQTANLLTPLPDTINWPTTAGGSRKTDDDHLLLLNRDGELLNGSGYPQPGGELPPYELFTGRQFVYQDHANRGGGEGWSMKESREIYNAYTAKLKPVDRLYEAIFKRIERQAEKTGGAVPHRVE